MTDCSKVYSSEELAGLTDEQKATLQQELERQIRASREIRAIINAHDEMNESLKEKLRDTLDRLKSGSP
jgi:hypothetical protein